MNQVDNLMRLAISDKVFPGAVLLVSKEDSIVFFEAYGYANNLSSDVMTKDTIFDLASLTKPLATTLAVMILIQQSRLDLEQKLGSVLPEFKNTDKEEIKIKHLLCHSSGFPDYRPYYRTLCKLPRAVQKEVLKELLIKEPLLHPIGKRALYSDLGFMTLGLVVERVSGKRLDHFTSEEIYRPLGIETDFGRGLFFIDIDSKPGIGRFAATEYCSWRNFLVNGVVHDENAYAVGGVGGHAGLFGNAGDMNILLSELLFDFHSSSSTSLFKKDLLHTFFKPREGNDKAFGFDTPSLSDSSSGNCFSKRSIGHLGFTGTSFWIDLERKVIVILLTNRIHPTRDNMKIKDFRPKIHNAVMLSLLKM
ncbi:MAG: beta-lactamase family protein [Deltaproteobacteria bacterium]|nr:beta-lactamase family protein [Deltaproteobacteria bacterium]MBW2661601.1 beta-lactamase family protein [Deltaproteobacteria bacterium]